MKESEFRSLDPLADALNEQCDRWFAAPEFAALQAAIRKASAALPPTYSVAINVELLVFDVDREQSLSLLTTGVNTSQGQAPYRTTGDSSIHRYIVGGEICEVPHDRCPHCWKDWDFKLQNPTCPSCGYSLGKEVKLLLDRDICPYCERGRLSTQQLTCSECDFRIDPSYVAWG
jgi:hypothetical protein